MQATIKKPATIKFNASTLDKLHTATLAVIIPRGHANAARELVEARFYGVPGQTQCYCAVWVHPLRSSEDNTLRGTGASSGMGAHKASEALDRALGAAGVSLDTRLDGAGREAMRAAVLAVAVATNPGVDSGAMMVVAYGGWAA